MTRLAQTFPLVSTNLSAMSHSANLSAELVGSNFLARVGASQPGSPWVSRHWREAAHGTRTPASDSCLIMQNVRIIFSAVAGDALGSRGGRRD